MGMFTETARRASILCLLKIGRLQSGSGEFGSGEILESKMKPPSPWMLEGEALQSGRISETTAALPQLFCDV